MTQNSDQKQSYGQIIKSTTIIGGSSIIVVFLRIVQAKAMAVMLGPAGVGLIGLYNSITMLGGQITSMGTNNSGVRQIAEAAGSDDKFRITRTISTLRRLSILLGFTGMLLLILFRKPISRFTFGDTDHANSLALLSAILFLMTISGAQAALIQGLRRIGDLARMNIFGAFLGLSFSIPIVYFWREAGIVPALMMIATMAFLPSWWYSHKVKILKFHISWPEFISETKNMLQLGIALMASGLMTTGAMYCIRVIVVRKLGLDAAGLYQASTAISGVYVGFILQAMAADFYPRLTAAANDNIECNRMVNEQAEVGLLLAVPGILATLTFAPYVIQIFYSSQFSPAMTILRWQILGVLLRVACWPMGFILLAKGMGKLFIFTEFSASIINVVFVYFLLSYFGLQGAGMASFGLYIFYFILIFTVAIRVSGFSWSKANKKIGAIIAPAVTVVFLSLYLLPRIWATVIGSTVTIFIGLYFLKLLRNAIGPDKFNDLFIKFKKKIHLS